MGIVTTKNGKKIPLRDRMSGVEILTHPEVEKLKKYDSDKIMLTDPDTREFQEIRRDREYEIPPGAILDRTGQNSRGSLS